MVINIKTKEEQKEVTICTKCKYFHNKEPNSVREHVWYNHLCKANPLPTKVNPYNGVKMAYGVNDLGGEYFSSDVYKNCRDINKGNCESYKKK
jgi:hypothetical protein